jgi:transcriptional regulator with XRE-family HTH domain
VFKEGDDMCRKNITGRQVAYLRSQKKWTQEILAAKLQAAGVDLTRLSVARIEYGILKVNDTVLGGLQRVFRLPIIQFFPQELQVFDADLARRSAAPLLNSGPLTKSRSKCQKLTKRRKEA